jgi:hypothetical protein
MKYQLSKILLISAALAISSGAQAGSILVLESSTTKIEVIGTEKKSVAVLGMPAKKMPLEPVAVVKPEAPVVMKKLDEPVENAASSKPVLNLGSAKLRTSNIDLPVVQTSSTEVDMMVSD